MSAVKRHKGSHEWKSNNQGNQQSSSNHQTNKGQFKKKHGGRGKEKAPANQQQQHVHITSSGIVADDIQTPWIPQIPVTQVLTPSVRLPPRPNTLLKDRIANNNQLASGVGHEPSFWLGQAQSSSLIDRIREPSNRKDPEATAAFIKDLRFQKNNKRKTPEPEEDAISWGSDTEPAPLGDAEMEDAYGQDFSDDDYRDMDYSNNFENQTVDGTMQ
ncbi:hypothetical protein H0H81_009809, partial [Sphagnurus paluster]